MRNQILVYTPDISFENAIDALDKNGNGFLALVKEDRTLLGIITDGDVRRAFLKREFDIQKIINRNPVTFPQSKSRKEVITYLRSIHRRHMPIVDERYKLVDIVILDEFQTVYRPNKVIIMAGGLGSRLGSLTKDMPKPMLPVSGKPLLEHIIENFKNQGFNKFILCVNYKSQIIKNHFNDGLELGVEIQYTQEATPLGTAGALSLIDYNRIKEPLIVTNGDILTSLDYVDFLNAHVQNDSHATMCVRSHVSSIPFAQVEFDDELNLRALNEKPDFKYHINSGIYILNPEVLKLLPYNERFDMTELFQLCVERGYTTKVFKMDEYWLDIGKPSDYLKVNNSF